MSKFMNWNAVIIPALLFLTFYSGCAGNSPQAETESDSHYTDTLLNTDSLVKNSANDFDDFLGIKYGTHELYLESILGKFTSGEYTADSSQFIYHFNVLEKVPVYVWVSAKTQTVQTIFMEVLSYPPYFDADLDSAANYYQMIDEDKKFFGKKPAEIIALMGEPYSDQTHDSNFRELTYQSDDYMISVGFRFYPEQNEMCSSISVNWFYKQ